MTEPRTTIVLPWEMIVPHVSTLGRMHVVGLTLRHDVVEWLTENDVTYWYEVDAVYVPERSELLFGGVNEARIHFRHPAHAVHFRLYWF